MAVRASDWGGSASALFFQTVKELRAQFNLHPWRVAAHDDTNHESGATASDSRRAGSKCSGGLRYELALYYQ